MPPKSKFTDEEIAAAAMDIVRESGWEKVTARSLGGRLGSSTRPIFTVFENMEQIREMVVREAKRLYNTRIREGLAQSNAFKGVGMAYIRFARDEPQLFKLLFMTGNGAPDRLEKRFEYQDDNWECILQSVQRSTGLDRERAKKQYLYLWLFSHSIATLYANGVCRMTEEQVSDMLTEVFQGMLCRLKGSGIGPPGGAAAPGQASQTNGGDGDGYHRSEPSEEIF